MIDVVLEDGSVTKGVANLNQLSGTSEKASLSIGKIATSLGLVKVASKAFDILKSSVSGAVERFDTLQKFPKVMESLGFSTEQSAAASKKLSDGIDGLPTTLQEVVSSTQRMTAITGDLDKSTDATIAMNNAFLASGASTDAASRGMDQYMKIVSTGKVELDSWTTLQETMPLALQKTAEAMGYAGKTAQNDLYAALKNGTVTFDEFQDKLIELGTGTGMLADLAKKNSLGIGTSFKNLNSSITKGMANVLTKFDEIVQKLSGKSIAQNIDGLKALINSFFAGVVSGMDLIVPLLSGFGKLFSPIISVVKSFGSTVGTVMKYVISNFTDFGKHMSMTMQIKEILPESVFNGLNKLLLTMNRIIAVVKYTILSFTDFSEHLRMTETIAEFLPQKAFDKLNEGLRVVHQFIAGIKGIPSIVSGASASLEEFADAIGVDLDEGWVEPYYNFGIKVKGIFDDIKSYISNTFSEISTTVVGSFDGLKSIDLSFFNDVLSNVFNNFKNNINSIIDVIKELLPVISTIFGGVVDFVKNFISSFGDAAGSVGNNVGQIISIVSMLSSPLGLIGFLFKNFGKQIIDTFSSLANSLAPLLSNLGSMLGTAFGSIGPLVTSALSTLVPVISQVINTIFNVISTVAPVIINVISQLLPVITQIIETVVQLGVALFPIIGKLVNTLLPVIENIIQALMNVVSSVAPLIITVIQTIMNVIQAMLPIIISIISIVADVVGSVISYIGTVITVVSNVIAIIMSFITPIVAFIAMIISSIMAVISPIIAFVSGVFSTVSSVISSVWNGIMNTTSSIFNAIGTIISGISGVVSSVFNTISSTISRVMNGVSSTITGVFTAIQNSWTGLTGFVNGIFDGIGVAIDSLVSSVKGTINAVIGGINGAIGIINKIPGVSIGTIPQLRSGTKNWRGGLAFMNEGGRGEIVNLPNGTQVIPHDISAMYAKNAAAAIGKAMSNFSMPDITAELALGIGPKMTTGNASVANYYNTVNSGTDKEEKFTINIDATVEMEAQKVGRLTAVHVENENDRRSFIRSKVRGE
ncbi:tape measure protein [Enterococcus larvae]|uniref:tape measure protein n=1 Tax=Enterococcus larvae TaxID=2794352 RepID=UPI003F324F46